MATYDQYREALLKAHRAGDTRAANLIAQKIKEGAYEKESSTLASAMQGIGQGTTLGTGEEIGAGVRAAAERYVNPAIYALSRKFSPYGGQEDKGVGELYREFQDQYYGEPIGERYAQNLASQRQALETAKREDPGTVFAGELAGGLMTGGAGMAKAAAAPTVLRAGARMVPTGAAIGGAGGYGYSEAAPVEKFVFGDEDVEEGQEEWKPEAIKAASDAAKGAGIGAVTSFLTPAAGAAARSVGRLASKFFTRDARLTNEARQTVLNSLLEDIDTGHISSMENLKNEMTELGLSVADAGPALQKLTQTLSQRPTVGARQTREFLTGRTEEQMPRLMPKLSAALGAKDHFARAYRRIVKNAKERGKELYDESFAHDVRLTSDMWRIMRHPEFRSAMRTANRLRADKGLPPLPKKIEIGTMMKTRELDQIVKGMDATVTSNFKSAPAIAHDITKPRRDQFTELLYKANPAYERARKQWSGDKLNQEAMDRGLQLFSKDADYVLEELRGMGPSEKLFFRIGALRAIKRKMGGKRESQDVIKGIFDTPNRKDAVRVAFGSKKKFNDFYEFIEAEQKKFDTFVQATGNSKTMERLLADADLTENLAGLLGFASTGSLLAAALAKRGTKALYKGIRPEGFQKRYAQALSRQQSDILTGGPEQLDALTQIRMPGLLGTGGQPNLVGRPTGGLLSTSAVQPESEQ